MSTISRHFPVDPFGMEDLLQLDACRPTAPIRLPARMEEVTTPLRWQEWDRCLANYPDQRFRAYITSGIRYGFRVGFDCRHACRKSRRNMSSAQVKTEVVRDYLALECSDGRVLGPFEPSWFPQIHTSSIGVIRLW